MKRGREEGCQRKAEILIDGGGRQEREWEGSRRQDDGDALDCIVPKQQSFDVVR